MNITVNGKKEKLVKEISINDYIEKKKLDPEKIITVYNEEVIDKENWNEIILQEKDNLEILKFVGGG
ncbi:MAG: sulfur carrier protein ThiS [Bacillota bacterium]